MGNCTKALEHFDARGKNRVTSLMLRRYFKTKRGQRVWKSLEIGPLEDVEFDHVLPTDFGGYSHLYNMFAMPRRLNRSDAFKCFGREKMEYIGISATNDVKNFHCWIRKVGEDRIALGEFKYVRFNFMRDR